MPTVLSLRDVTLCYGGLVAVDSLSLHVRRGEVYGLLGPNGSGKTTALRLMLGFLKPTAGTASIGGHDCWADSVNARRQVAYLPGELRLYENMTGRQIVRFLNRLRGLGTDGEVDALAKRFDIDIDRPLANLSSGMKRKVALLTVLVPRTPLVIMDEPTNALDPTMRDLLLDQVALARGRGQAVLFSSHVLAEVERVCDRVAILQRGRLVHEQDMAHLQEGRLVHVRFARPAEPPPALAGLSVREASGDRMTMEYAGPLPELLAWLSARELAELRVEPLGLNAIYYRYHGNAE